MKVLFYNRALNFRGTTVAITDYAKYNQELLTNESIIAYDSNLGYNKDMGSEPEVVEALKKTFKVIDTNEQTIEQVIENEKIDVAYFIRAGMQEFLPKNCTTVVHAVFPFKEVHGSKYAYISKWLSDKMSGGSIPFVPHIVSLPTQTVDIRSYLGIGIDKIIIGRIGGYLTFDIPEVKQSIAKLLEITNKFVFLFVGTEPFISHKNCIFIKEIHDIQLKSNFIHSCDAMLHARQMGESFGLSIAEFLYCNKPVIAFNGGRDKNHLELLKDSNTLYSNEKQLFEILTNIKDIKQNWFQRVNEFNPVGVMKKFKEVFLK